MDKAYWKKMSGQYHSFIFFALQIKRREVKIYERGVVKLELNRNDSINFSLRMPVSLRLDLQKIAQNEDRTVTNLINTVLKNYVERYNGEAKK